MRWRPGMLLMVLMVAAGSHAVRAEEPEGLFEYGEIMALDAVVRERRAELRRVEEPPRPWIHTSMPHGMRGKVERAFEIAADRVREVAECADLFAEFEVDGLEMLVSTLYFPAGPHRQTTRCRHSFAVTSIGANTTWVCRKVTAHPDERIAMALIHEALHHAGMGEYPIDRGGLRSRDINTLVSRHCHFD